MTASTNVTNAISDTPLSDAVADIKESLGNEMTEVDENFLTALLDYATFLERDEIMDLRLLKLAHLESGEEEYEELNYYYSYHGQRKRVSEWLRILRKPPHDFIETLKVLTTLYPLITDELICKLYLEFEFEGTALQRYLDLAGE